ncbi:hypothetical protein BB559_005133 [Furculomyces boomerangus]|uniref:Protein kinase domain-containing protein n=2 Tax=Harpellales TaxID=61421 RepID=A0A2T9YAL5_9FUNG|nr:hypothetical protein BB559_005133 [Furculomyces boomerangus]PVZ97944.1 hypothetical protein BB558_006078 [Smittium angustum]
MSNYNPQRDKKKVGSMLGHSIDGGNLQFVKLIGVGTYGEVYRTIDRKTGEEYAVKILNRRKSQSQEKSEQFIDARLLSHEIDLYTKISPHPNVIKLERILHTNDQLFIVMETCLGGDLFENISTNAVFKSHDPSLIKHIFLQLLSAVHHIHNHEVYHRDLKPENILVTKDSLNVKIIDFGLATNKKVSNEIGCGSAYYMSPECQGGIGQNKCTHYETAPNDVWALGVILINLATGRNPWNKAHVTDPLFQKFLIDKTFLFNAINASTKFRHIISRALDINPKTRCSITELYSLIQNCNHFISSDCGTPVNQKLNIGKPTSFVKNKNLNYESNCSISCDEDDYSNGFEYEEGFENYDDSTCNNSPATPLDDPIDCPTMYFKQIQNIKKSKNQSVSDYINQDIFDHHPNYLTQNIYKPQRP